MARANAEHGGGAKKTFAGAVQMFRELSHSTVALIAGKSEDADEDPEYLKVHDYGMIAWTLVILSAASWNPAKQ